MKCTVRWPSHIYLTFIIHFSMRQSLMNISLWKQKHSHKPTQYTHNRRLCTRYRFRIDTDRWIYKYTLNVWSMFAVECTAISCGRVIKCFFFFVFSLYTRHFVWLCDNLIGHIFDVLCQDCHKIYIWQM